MVLRQRAFKTRGLNPRPVWGEGVGDRGTEGVGDQTEEFHRVYWCICWFLLLRIQTRTQRFTKKGTSRCSIDKDSPVTSPELSVATPVHVCVCVCVLVCVCMCACVCVCVCVCYVRLSYACHHISWESINAGTPPPQNITCSST